MSSRLHGTFSILIFFLVFQSLIGIAQAWDGVVVRVVDGDTLLVAPKTAKQPELLGISVRRYGIDAPELTQPGGQASTATLEHFILEMLSQRTRCVAQQASGLAAWIQPKRRFSAE